MSPGRPTFTLRSRPRTYSLILGVITAMVAAGLAIPFVFGKPVTSVLHSAGSPLAVHTSSTLAGAATQATDAPPAAGSVVAGTGSVAHSGATGGVTGANSPVATGLTASDHGVTATTVTIAFLLSDLGSAGKLGFGVPGDTIADQKGYINAFVNDVNKHGGILGRKVLPVFASYDPTDQSSSQTACLSATQDQPIFAAVDSGGGLNEEGTLCFTQQNHTPLIGVGSFGNPAYLYSDSAGYLFSIAPAGARSLANMAYMLNNLGKLKGKTLGIVDRDFPGSLQTVTDGLVNILKQSGIKIAYRADLSSNDGTAGSQVPVAMSQMQSHGVDAVFMLADLIIGSEFVQAADKAAYRPLYFMSDFESETNDIAVTAMPKDIQAVGITVNRTGEWRVGAPEPAIDAACNNTYAAASGSKPARGDNAYALAGLACGMVTLVAKGARAAGPNLTRQKFVAGLQAIGTTDFPFMGSFSYRPNKFDGADAVREIDYDASCSCWLPKGNFIPPAY